MYKNVYLKRGKEESMKRFHPWVFSGALHHMDEGLHEGEIVNVISAGGEYITGRLSFTDSRKLPDRKHCRANTYFRR
mgnify:CR=1 FL=1